MPWMSSDRTNYGPIKHGTAFEVTDPAEVQRLLKHGYRVIPQPVGGLPARPIVEPPPVEVPALADAPPETTPPVTDPETTPPAEEKPHLPRLDELSGGKAGKHAAPAKGGRSTK